MACQKTPTHKGKGERFGIIKDSYPFKGNSVFEVLDGNTEVFPRGKYYFPSHIKDIFSDSPAVELKVYAFLLNRK